MSSAVRRHARVVVRFKDYNYDDGAGRKWLAPSPQRPFEWLVSCRGNPRPPHPVPGEDVQLRRVITNANEFGKRASWPLPSHNGTVYFASFGGQGVGGFRPATGYVVFAADAEAWRNQTTWGKYLYQ